MTSLADKEQPLLRPVLLGRMPAVWTGLAGVVGIDFDAERAGQHRFVVQEGVQFGEGPLGGMSVRPPLLFARLLAAFAFASLSYMRQIFQADERVGMGVQHVLADPVVGLQLQPSLSPADGNAPSGRRASAFALEPLLQAGIMVRLAADLLSRIELRAVGKGGNGGKIALPHVYPDNAGMTFWGRVRRFNRQADQQIEALSAPVMPEFGFADFVPSHAAVPDVCCSPGRGSCCARRGSRDLPAAPSSRSSHARRRRSGSGRRIWALIQSFETLLGVAQAAGLGVLPGFGPQTFVSGSHLPGHTAGHLSRQAKLSAHVSIGLFLETLAVAHLAMGKRVGADVVQRIPVGQLGLPEGGELVRRRQQFQLGGQGYFHAAILSHFCVQKSSGRMARLPPTPQDRGHPPRTYRECGTELDRDHNAAINILRAWKRPTALRGRRSPAL